MGLVVSAVSSEVAESKGGGLQSSEAAQGIPVLGGKRVETFLIPLCHWHSVPWTLLVIHLHVLGHVAWPELLVPWVGSASGAHLQLRHLLAPWEVISRS